MAKASIRLPNGTAVLIEGTTDEVRQLLEFYGRSAYASATRSAKRQKLSRKRAQKDEQEILEDTRGDKPNLAEIINLIKNCEEAEAIEAQILDRTSQVNRILLPLYIVHKHLGDKFGLTSGNINKITTDLGIPIQTPNVSNKLSGTASRYVIGHAVREQGKVIRYKLSRRGVKYLSSVLKGSADDKQG